MENKPKKILITIIILLIIIIAILLITKKVNEKFILDEIEFGEEVTVNETLETVTSRSNYYIAKSIVEKYYSSLCNLNKTSEDVLIFEYDEEVENLEEEIAQEKEYNKKRIYSFFDEKYIEETSLSIDNIQENLGNYSNLYVLIEEMYVREITETVKVYFIFGSITEKQTFEKENIEIMVATDTKNRTFNIYTSDYIDKNNLYELSKDENFAFDVTEIENRTYNTYDFETIDDETYVKDLLSSYTQSIKYNNLDYSYNNLNEEYKVKRFITKSDYEEYIDKNKSNITIATLKYYKKNEYEGYNQYIAIDQSGNYYIFNETSVMNYELMLDIYTIDIPEFTSKYESATTEEKVMLNIQKIVEALNAEDYNYIYGKLADEFKENYFNTYEEFEKYAEETFDIENEVVYNKYTESDTLSTYEITLEGKNKTITKTIVMRLEEGTDFVMSFNVK